MKNRIISLFLIISLIITMLPSSNAYALTIPTDQDSFIVFLAEQGIPTETDIEVELPSGEKKVLEANYDIYREYNEIVYGNQLSVSYNDTKFSDETGKTEYRYLGYMVDGVNKVANNKFPVDVQPSTSPLYWHYLEVGDRGLWDQFETDVKEYIYNTRLTNPTYDITESSGLTAKYIDDRGKSFDSSPNNQMGAYARLQTRPSWFSDGTVYIKRLSSGKTWYATFVVGEFAKGTHIDYTIDTPSTVTITSEEDEVLFDVDVSSTIILEGAAKAAHITDYTIDIEGNTNTVTGVVNNSHSITKTVSRTNVKDGQVISIPITITYKTIFDDTQTINTTAEIVVIVEEKEDSYISVLTTVDPESEEYNSRDVFVDVLVESTVYGIDSLKVDSMELIVNDQSYFDIGVSTIQNTFYFTIDRENIESVEESLSKKWKIKAIAYLVDGTTLEITETKETIVFKNNALPIVTIYSDDEVRAFEDIYFSANASSPIDADIVNYVWGLDSGSVGEILPGNRFGHTYYNTTGKKDIYVWVTDEIGNKARADKQITVTPPEMYSHIKTEGQLKENHIIEVWSDPDSPDYCPVDDNLRDWTITPTNGIDVSELITLGFSDESSRFQLVAKDSGQVTLDLYEENQLGYSDTISQTLDIVKDIPPVANFYINSTIYRNPENFNYAEVTIANTSYSPDYDELGYMEVSYRYDSDNDGNYDEETWTNVYQGEYQQNITFNVGGVGNYQVKLLSKEKFDIISGMNSEDDFLSDETIKTFTVDNLAPSVDLNLQNKINIDLNFSLGDYQGMDQGSLTNYIENSLKPKLESNGYNLENYNIFDGTVKDQLLSSEEIYKPNGDEWITSATEDYVFITGHAITTISSYFYDLRNNVLIDLETFKNAVGYDNYNYQDELKGNYIYETEDKLIYVIRTLTSREDYNSFLYVIDKDTYEYNWIAIEGYHGKIIPHNNHLITESSMGIWVYDINTLQEIASAPYYKYIYSIGKDDKYVAIKSKYSSSTMKFIDIENNTLLVDKPEGYVHVYETSFYEKDSTFRTDNNSNFNLSTHVYTTTSRSSSGGKYERYWFKEYRDNYITGERIYLADELYKRRYTSSSGRSGSTAYYIENLSFFHPRQNIMVLYNHSGHDDTIRFMTHTFESSINEQVRGLNDTYYINLDNSNPLLFSLSDYVNQIKTTCLENNVTFMSITDNVSNYTDNIVTTTEGVQSKLTEFVDNLISYLDSTIERSNDTIDGMKVITAEDTINFNTFYMDYENDPLYNIQFVANHIDPNYFDNSNGTFDTSTLSVGSDIFLDKVGLYELDYSVQDNPKDIDAFDNFRYWSDSKTTKVLVHRKPICDYIITGVYKDGLVIEDHSYDLDHSLTDPNKGIVKREYRYKEIDGLNWISELPRSLDADVSYYFSQRVKDVEGSWSNWKTELIEPINDTAPITLNANIKSKDSSFTIGSIPSSEYLTVYDLETKYASDHFIIIDLLDGETVIKSIDITHQEGITGTKVDTNIIWNDVDIQIPETLADNTYTVRVAAIDSTAPTNIDYKDFGITVDTPIDLNSTLPNEIRKDITYSITATTSKYADALSLELYRTTGYSNTINMILNRTENDRNYWIYDYTENRTIPDSTYQARVIATTPNGNTEYKDHSFEAISNIAPTVNIVNTAPLYIYEGDHVYTNIQVNDADLDTLDVKVFLLKNDSIIATRSYVSSPSGGIYPLLNADLIDNITTGTYEIKVSVSDGNGGNAVDVYNFSVNELSIIGNVNHTTKWNENRIAYNQSKTGTEDDPRSSNTYWSGERFMLNATTTTINEQSNVRVDYVTVSILSNPYSISLIPSDEWSWTGELWDESMINRWGRNSPESITFRFVVEYSNSTVKSYDVTVLIDNLDDYWRHHRLF